MFTTFSLAIILDCTVRIVLGTALGALIGLERQLRARSARRALGCGAHHHVRLTPAGGDRNSATSRTSGMRHRTASHFAIIRADCLTHSTPR